MSEIVVWKFVQLTDDHNVNVMVDLMTEDHKFMDAIGGVVSDRQPMGSGWIGYFKWFPDYKIEVKETYSFGDTFVVLGFASGTYAGRRPNRIHWRLPAAWKAVVKWVRIEEWNVYCDTRKPYEIIAENESQVGG